MSEKTGLFRFQICDAFADRQISVWVGMKTVGNDRKKPQLFSVSHFFSETISITVLTETNTVPIIRELRKRNYPIENSSISVENR